MSEPEDEDLEPIKEVEAREAARQARLENDPKYWKRTYQWMFEREEERREERKTQRDAWIGAVMVFATLFAIVFLLKIFGFY